MNKIKEVVSSEKNILECSEKIKNLKIIQEDLCEQKRKMDEIISVIHSAYVSNLKSFFGKGMKTGHETIQKTGRENHKEISQYIKETLLEEIIEDLSHEDIIDMMSIYEHFNAKSSYTSIDKNSELVNTDKMSIDKELTPNKSAKTNYLQDSNQDNSIEFQDKQDTNTNDSICLVNNRDIITNDFKEVPAANPSTSNSSNIISIESENRSYNPSTTIGISFKDIIETYISKNSNVIIQKNLSAYLNKSKVIVNKMEQNLSHIERLENKITLFQTNMSVDNALKKPAKELVSKKNITNHTSRKCERYSSRSSEKAESKNLQNVLYSDLILNDKIRFKRGFDFNKKVDKMGFGKSKTRVNNSIKEHQLT